ncbi:MAG: type II secretion system F family protein [Ectothiorhodospiraceae bacterium]|nr:type II secretion system F family protein [Chromatiales bacterium]MCP5154963.1 type II secretion system F family protein [Ectothiorhodospiraceae bacterium]
MPIETVQRRRVAEVRTGEWRAMLARPPDPTERRFFTGRLALLLETGNALHPSLTLLARQSASRGMREVVERVARDVAEGLSLARALGRHPTIFPPVHVSLVGAAERGGFLAEALDRLTALEERRERLRQAVTNAALYPAFLAVFSVLVVIFILTVVFPKFDEMFAAIRDRLPATTVVLMSVSEALRAHWELITGVVVAGILAARRVLAAPGVRHAWHGLMLRLPGLRTLAVELYLAQALRVLGLSLGHGVGIIESLSAARDVVGNEVFRDLLSRVGRGVEEGRTIADGFERAPLMPDLARQMIATGEASGSLPVVLDRLAEHYETELTRRLGLVARLAEPLMLLVMGVLVGVIVSALILPIFQLSRAVG